ncbi:hypothetical protein KR038_000973 [Drosophila bunnanda]|nr:hypothetical protein KR038_000973 [Drosophila bunnanda]
MNQLKAYQAKLRIEHWRNSAQPQRTAAVVTAAALASGEARQKAAMAEATYNWLEPDANDKKHDASRKHAEGLERQRSNNAKEAAPSVSINNEATVVIELLDSSSEDNDSDTCMVVR